MKKYPFISIALIITCSILFVPQLFAQQISEEVKQYAKEQYPELFLPKDEFETKAEYKERVKQQKKIIIKVEKELAEKKRATRINKTRLVAEKAKEAKRQKEVKIAASLKYESLKKVFALGKYQAEDGYFNFLKEKTEYLEVPGSGYIVEKYLSGQSRDANGKTFVRAVANDFGFSGRLMSSPNWESEPIRDMINGEKLVIISKNGFWVKVSPVANKKKTTFKASMTVGYKLYIPRNEARSFKQNYGSVKVEGYKKLKDDLETYEYFNMVAIHPITGSRFPFGPEKHIAAAPIIASKKAVVPPDLTMRVAFVEPNSNGFLDAEEKGRVKVSITNSGKGSGMGVFVNLKADSKDAGVSFESSKIIGEVPAGDTKSTEFEIRSSKSVSRMENQFTVSATESYGFPPDPVQISFETYPFIPPQLNLVDFGISTATGDNVIRPGVVTIVQARVQNEGQGPAEDVKFSINLPTGVYPAPDSKNSYTFSFLKPGEFKDLEFSFTPSKTVSKTIAITIGFTEESSTGTFPINLEVKKPQKTIQQLVVTGQELAKVDILNVATISVDVEKNIPKTGRKGKNDLAIVFGIESYKNVPGVSFAKRDAMWMKKYFENVLGIPTKRIYYKTDSDVSLAEFNLAFGGWLKKRLKKKTNVFIYYAGHGAPDIKQNKAYLIPYDGNPNYASQTGYEMDELYEQLGDLGAASVTVFLDACFTGANRNNEMLLADARPVFMEVDATATGNVTVFSAAGGKEISSAWPEKKHGLFSYYLMKGMRGDADANKDKKITVGELGDYVKENVSDMAGMLDREQTPELQTMDRGKVLINY